jgi:DNA repair protein RadC
MIMQDSILYVRDQESRRYRRAQPREIVHAAHTAIDALFARGAPMSSVAEVTQFVSAKLAARESEVFACLFLDNKHRLMAYEELFFGTVDASAVYPREIVKRALRHNAAAVILTHNHPSGVAEPSRSDEMISLRIREALGFVDIKVLDHVIVGANTSVSLAERGLL